MFCINQTVKLQKMQKRLNCAELLLGQSWVEWNQNTALDHK